MMVKQTDQSIGGNGANVLGNNNRTTINNYGSEKVLTKSICYELLKVFYDQTSHHDEAALKKPMGFRSKLKFNNVKRYQHIFDMYSPQYALIDEAFRDFPNSADMILELETIFCSAIEFDSEGCPVVPADGDRVLDVVRDELYKRIVDSKDFDSEKFFEETVESFVIALMAYGVHGCKILVNENGRVSE